MKELRNDNIRREIAGEVETSLNIAKCLEPIDCSQESVVRNLIGAICAVDSCEHGHRDICQLRIINDNNSTGKGKVGRSNVFYQIVVKAKVLAHVRKAG